MRKAIGVLTLIACLLAGVSLLAGVLITSTPADAQYFSQHINYTNITTDTTTQIKPAPGILHTVCINGFTTAGDVITLWDSLSAAGTKIGTITIPTAQPVLCLVYNVSFNVGLTVQTATQTADLTITWE